MESITAQEIRETMLAGRTIEARAMLIGAGDAISADERSGLAQELLRLHTEIERLIASGEALEREGRIDEAKGALVAARQLSSDFPGLDEEIKRLDESRLLAQAVKHRNQRTREAAPERLAPAEWRQRLRPLAPALTAGLAVVLLGFLLLRGKDQSPPQTPAPPQEQVTTAAAPPAAPPADEPAPVPAAPAAPAPTAPPPPPAPAPPAGGSGPQPAGRVYTVRPGDSLSTIATRELCRQPAWEEIYQLNKDVLADPTKLQPGMQLRLDGIEGSCGRNR